MTPTSAEVLARALYQAGPLIPGLHVPTTAWEQLPLGAKRQWLEGADYLMAVLRGASYRVVPYGLEPDARA